MLFLAATLLLTPTFEDEWSGISGATRICDQPGRHDQFSAGASRARFYRRRFRQCSRTGCAASCRWRKIIQR